MKKILAAFLCLIATDGMAQIITTVAGQTNNAGYSGDSGPALQATLNGPSYIAFDRKGNMYFAEKENHCVRRVAPNGTITTLAGTGIAGFSGDDGPASAAQLRWPVGVAVDSLGNVFIGDGENYRIRKVDTSGIITTAYGTGIYGFGGDSGPADLATFGYINGLAFDSKWNLIICDFGPHARVRVVDQQGIINTLAGSNGYGFSGDGGPATAAKLFGPLLCTVDGDDNVYITDAGNYRIRKVTRTTGIITTIAGTGAWGYSGDGGPATQARFNFPRGIACDKSGNIFVGDLGGLIRKIDTFGIITRYCGDSSLFVHSGDGGPALQARLNGCAGLAFDSSGNLYLAEFYGHTIRRISAPVASVSAAPKRGVARLSVYPNPTRELLNLAWQQSSGADNLSLRIVDFTGRIVGVQALPPTATSTTVNLYSLPPGVYSVILIGDGYVLDAESVVKQ